MNRDLECSWYCLEPTNNTFELNHATRLSWPKADTGLATHLRGHFNLSAKERETPLDCSWSIAAEVLHSARTKRRQLVQLSSWQLAQNGKGGWRKRKGKWEAPPSMPWPNSYLSTNEQISGLTNKHRRGVYLFELTAGGIAHPLVRRKQVENGTLSCWWIFRYTSSKTQTVDGKRWFIGWQADEGKNDRIKNNLQ